MICVFFDTETTGPDVNNDEIVELAYERRCFSPSGESEGLGFKQFYIKAGKAISPEASAVNGISPFVVERAGVLPEQAYGEFLQDLKDADYLVAHNLKQFDLPMVKQNLARYSYKLPDHLKFIDTMTDVPYPEHITTRKLSHLAADHGFLNFKAHSAIFDVATMSNIFCMYPLATILELSAAKTITVKILTEFKDKEEARKRKFRWEPTRQAWIKEIKDKFLDQERERAKPFGLTVL